MTDPTGAKVVLLSSDTGLEETISSALGSRGHSLVRFDRVEQLVASLGRGTIDIALVDSKDGSLPTSAEMRPLHEAAGAAAVVCLSDKEEDLKAGELLKPGATRCFRRSASASEWQTVISKLMEIVAHRKELAACEKGELSCPLKKPVAHRDRSRAWRRITIATIAVIVIALLAIPTAFFFMDSAAESAKKADEGLKTIEEIRGYLQRDEQREIESRKR